MSNLKDNEITALLNAFKRFIDLSEPDQSTIVEAFQRRYVLRREFILQKDQICKYDNFVVKGSFRSFFVDEDGEEHILP